MTIDPNNVTDYWRSHYSLLEFWLFCLFVRGKNADVQAKKLDQFISLLGGLEWLKTRGPLFIEGKLREVKAGQYTTLTAAIDETLLQISRYREFLTTATVEELEAITGVGPKTARYFILHTQKGVRVAALDTHIMHFLWLELDADEGLVAPVKTPAGKKYLYFEQKFLDIADGLGVEPAVLDLAIWRASRAGNPLNWQDYIEGGKHAAK